MAQRGEPPEGTLGAEIRQRRRALGLSADKLATLLGTSRQTVLDWEWNMHVPNRDYRDKLNEALGDPPVVVSLAFRPRSAADQAGILDRLDRLEEAVARIERELRLSGEDGPRARRGER